MLATKERSALRRLLDVMRPFPSVLFSPPRIALQIVQRHPVVLHLLRQLRRQSVELIVYWEAGRFHARSQRAKVCGDLPRLLVNGLELFGGEVAGVHLDVISTTYASGRPPVRSRRLSGLKSLSCHDTAQRGGVAGALRMHVFEHGKQKRSRPIRGELSWRA